MGRRHGSARTTAAGRRSIQQRQESRARLVESYALNPRTVAKWKKPTHGHDAPLGPTQPRSTILTVEKAALIIAFRKQTLLPLDDGLYALHGTLPPLTRSALHRCLQRHGIRRLPAMIGEKPAEKQCKSDPIGYFHIDIAEVRTEEGWLSLLVALDRACTCASAGLHAEVNPMVAAQFLRNLSAAIPDKLRTVLIEHGIQFPNRKRNRYAFHQIFDRVYQEYGINHRLPKLNHPWTNRQVERMNRTLKDTPVQQYSYEPHAHPKEHLQAFLMTDNFAKRLKTRIGLTACGYICQCWQQEPERFTINPYPHTRRPNR
jgi:hypothetical protein